MLRAVTCERATVKHPEGRTGTPAGYQAHRDAGEPACPPCLASHSAASLARRRALPEDELAKYRQTNAAAVRKRRLEKPAEMRAAKHRFIAERVTPLIDEAKARPCADCGTHFPFYVMQFDHRDPAAKEFNISQRGPTMGRARLLREIAKCDVVCANCHAERTYQMLQTRWEADDVG